MSEPRELAEDAERWPAVPPGRDERFSGYGVSGVPFATGHYLALRRFTASSLAAPYTSVWHRDPAGRWTVYSTVAPGLSCPRYIGRALHSTVVTEIELGWTGPRSLRVAVAGVLDWELELRTTLATRSMARLGANAPLWLRRNAVYLTARSWLASHVLGVGHVALRGRVPNEHWFQAAPRRIWIVTESRATLNGEDLGANAPLVRQARLRDYWLPQRGMFFVGEAFFEARGTPPALP